MEGKLIYDTVTERLAIRDADGVIMPLHCGQGLLVTQCGTEQFTRVEYSEDWYLAGLYGAGAIPTNLDVRTIPHGA